MNETGGISGMGGSQYVPSGFGNVSTSGTQQVDQAYIQGELAQTNPTAEALTFSSGAGMGDEIGLMMTALGKRLGDKDKTNKPAEKRKVSTKSQEKTGETESAVEAKEATSHVQSAQQVKQKFKELLPDMDENQLENFMGRLKEREGDTGYTDTKMLKEAKEFFHDSSHQYAAIEYARVKIKEELNDPNLSDSERNPKATLLKLLQQGSNRLLREEGTAIRAGLNVSALAAAAEKGGLDTIDGLRNMYRNEILGHQNIVDTFKIMLKRFGTTRISQGAEFVLKAATTDLEAEQSSIEKGKLHDLLSDIYKMQTLSGMINRIQDFLDILEKEPPPIPPTAPVA